MTREDIKVRYKAGEITKDQAMMELESLRTGAPVASQDPREAIKAQYKSGAIDKPQAMQMLEQLRMAPQEEVGPVASFPPEPIADPAPIAQAPVEQPVPVAQGGIALPGHAVDAPPLAEQYSGLMKTIADMFSGESRKTKRSENLKGWQEIPELQEWAFSNIGPSFKTALGSMFSGDQKGILKTLQENYPDLEYDEDSKGNPIIKSNATGEWHSIKPGVRLGDVPAIAAQGLTIMGGPAKMMKHLPKMGRLKQMALAEGGSQAIIEGAKELGGAGGELGEVGLAAAMPVGTEVAGRALKGLKGAFSGVDEAVEQTAKAAAKKTIEEQREEIGQVAARAAESKDGKGISGLVDRTGPDPDRLRAAKEEGYEHYLQPDHVSTDQAFQELTQLLKSQKGSMLRDQEREGLRMLGEDAVETVKSFGATEDLGGLSEKIREGMHSTIDGLSEKARLKYDEINARIDPGATVDASRTIKFLEDKAMKLGGEHRLTGIEKKVYKALKGKPSIEKRLSSAGVMEEVEIPDNPTYLLVDDLRKEVGELSSPTNFASTEKGKSKVLYELLSGDQEDAAGIFGASDLWDEAKLLVKQRKGIENDMQYLFGKKLDNSIVNKLFSANEGLAKTDAKKLDNLLKAIPKEYRSEFKSSAILKAFNKRGVDLENGPLVYKEFSNWYRNLNNSEGAKDLLFEGLAPEARRRMDNLFIIADGVHQSTKKYTGSGASLQQYFKEADGLLGSLLSIGTDAGAITGGLTFGGPAGAILTGIAVGMYRRSKAKKDPIELAVDKLLASNDLKDAMFKLSGGEKTAEKTAKRLSFSKPFRNFAKAAKLPLKPSELERWILASMRTQQNLSETEDGNPNK